MTRAIYPGTFDPMTFGHVDILRRALNCFEHVILAVADGGHKLPLFSHQSRVELARQCVVDMGWERVSVLGFSGLLVDFAKEQRVAMLIRGVRNAVDYVYETQLAGMNASLRPEIETILLPSHPRFANMSSSLVRDIARLGGDVSAFVPVPVVNEILHMRKKNS